MQLFNNEPVGAWTLGALEKVENGEFKQTNAGAEGTYRDVGVIGDIDEGVLTFAKLCGWDITNK